MPKILSIVISLIAFHTSTIAAPNQNKHPVINDNLEDISVFDNPFELSESIDTDQSSGEREKRFFDSIFSSIDLSDRRGSQFPNYNGYTSTENNRNTGGGGLDALLRNPYSLWLDLLSSRRTQPIVLPIFVQPITCACPGENSNSPPNKNKEPVPSDAPPFNGGVNTPPPDLTNRFNTGTDEDEDGRRPISFKPLEPKRPGSQPPPPFEHGSVQEGIESENSNDLPQETPAASSPPRNIPALSPSTQPEASARMPSICDGAIVACCFQTNIGNCFQRQGCADPSIYGDPCDPPVVFRVLESFQNYYKRRGIMKTFY